MGLRLRTMVRLERILMLHMVLAVVAAVPKDSQQTRTQMVALAVDTVLEVEVPQLGARPVAALVVVMDIRV